MKKIFILVLSFSYFTIAHSQSVGLGTTVPNASAALDLTSSNKGLLIPRMGSSSIHSIPNPAKGLLVYDSAKNQLMVNMGTAAAPDWETIIAGSGWGLTGNTHTDSTKNFIGTTDAQPLQFRVNGQVAGMIDSAGGNSYLGYGSGRNNTTGVFNTAFGYKAIDLNSTGSYNTAFGIQTLSVNTSGSSIGDNNTAIGYQALMNNRGNAGNTAVGYQALFTNASNLNTATGYQALYHTGSGSNTATGAQALFYGGGNSNTAIGAKALYNSLSSASYNTASGYQALYSNISGSFNTASGYQALFSNSSGQFNTAFGSGALYSNRLGNQNVSVGYNSLINTTGSDENTAIGYQAGNAYDNGYYNCFIGAETDATGPGFYNCIALGHGTLVTAPNMMRVGNGATVSIGGPVGWSTISDGRVKRNIKENVPGLSFIMKLRPVSYNVDLSAVDRIVQPPPAKDNDGKVTDRKLSKEMADARMAKEQLVYTGFVAQEVEHAAKSLHYDFSGVDAARNDKDLYSLRYADFVVPLVKAVQELSAQNDQLKKDNELLAKENEQAMQRITALKANLH